MLATAFALLPAAKATLLRRKADGTLLPGTCAPHEEAWERACLTHATNVGVTSDVSARQMLATYARFVGYRAYLRGARLSFLRWMQRMAPAEAHGDVTFVCDALDMMTQPWPLNELQHLVLVAETLLAHSIQDAFARDYISAAADDAGGGMLRAAWARVEHSGVLQARNAADGISSHKRNDERVASMAAASVAAKGLRFCALDSCGAREVHASQFKLCGACKTVCYCSKEHQAAHWRQHKAACKAARASAGGGAVPSDER
jgi:hypothetical protein